jgi:hypothetical protein
VAPRRALLAVLAVTLLAALAAGCGSGGSKGYTASSTATCLKAKGFTGVTTDPNKVGFIAAFAANGGLLAHTPDGGNTVTIAFTNDSKDAAATERAYTRHAPPRLRPHIADVMESQQNAVLVWTVSPTQQVLSDALACLKA